MSYDAYVTAAPSGLRILSASFCIVAILYGDTAATAMGWTPLGIGEMAGYRWAITRVREIVERVGAPAALRGSFTPTPTHS